MNSAAETIARINVEIASLEARISEARKSAYAGMAVHELECDLRMLRRNRDRLIGGY